MEERKKRWGRGRRGGVGNRGGVGEDKWEKFNKASTRYKAIPWL